jgi:Protein of unknown function (DUF2844)
MRKSLSFLLALAFSTAPAWAGLGMSEQSVHSDQQRLAGRLRSQTFETYTVHEISYAGGMVVREYVSPVGMVFGVVWEGPAVPDLTQLLGPYFADFQQAVASSPRRHGPLYIQAGQLVVESGGHMRAYRGRAYVSSLVPANLTKDVVR